MLRRLIGALLIIVCCLSFMAACSIGGENDTDEFFEYFDHVEADHEWRALLISTLTQLQKEGMLDEHFMDGYAVALFDINYDAIPELIEVEAGGSSGGVNYLAYDIKTGDLITEFSGGVFHSGQSDAWCLYYDTETKRLKAIESSTTKGGSTVLKRHISELVYDVDSNEYVEKSLFYINYEIENLVADDSQLVEDKVSTQHYYCNESVTVEEYNYQYDLFIASHIRLPDTGMKLIRWSDVDDTSDTEQSVINMVDALLSSGQKFVMKTQ